MSYELEIIFLLPASVTPSTLPNLLQIKTAVLRLLEKNGFTSIIESAGDLSQQEDGLESSVNSQGDDLPWPTLVYHDNRLELETFIQDLLIQYGPDIRTNLRSIPDTLATQAWLIGGPESFHCGRFHIIVDEGEAPRQGDLPIRIRPGIAFGAGDHLTTRAMLRAIEWVGCKGTDRQSILDIGTGNGILLVAAHHMGFKRLTGTDISSDILGEARTNLDLNGVKADLLEQEDLPSGNFDLVTINILYPLLHTMLFKCIDAVSDGGYLIIGGFPETEKERLLEKCRSAHFIPVHEEGSKEGWPAVVLTMAAKGEGL